MFGRSRPMGKVPIPGIRAVSGSDMHPAFSLQCWLFEQVSMVTQLLPLQTWYSRRSQRTSPGLQMAC